MAGFVHGTLLPDGERAGHTIRESIRTSPRQLITKATAALEQQLPGFTDALRDCADRGDEWLFHDLAARLVKQIYIAWFALEGHYLPFPKRLRQWIEHLGLNEQAARLEQRMWETTALPERRLAIVRFADHVLTMKPAV